MKKKILIIKNNIVLYLLPFFIPSFAGAAKAGDIRSLQASNLPDLATKLARFINSWLIPMFVLVALVYFLIGVVQYIGSYDDSKKEEKKQRMFWGIIGLLVMLSVWSLVFVIKNTFGISTGTNDGFTQLVD